MDLGNQNIPPPNMSLWHKDYFELKTIETLQMSKKAVFPHLPNSSVLIRL